MFKLCMLAVLCISTHTVCARGDVTITNPLLYADVPDPDVICVGKDYYMVSTTCHMSPGAPIMRSRDLEGGNIYSRGQWAASIRYDKGTFYVFFGTGVHSYIYKTKNPAGKWTMAARFERYYHDSSLLFDDDGKVYLVHCLGGVLYVKQFKEDLQDFVDGDANGTKIIALNDGCLHEGVHAYKIDGRYYMTTIWWPRGGDRTELCFRSDKVTGPYEQRTIMSDDLGFAHHGVAQGGIWQAANKQWYAMLFQDHEGVGRIPCLMPCTWVDGWPMLGDANGKVPRQFTIPGLKEKGKTNIVTSDDFSKKKLHPAWQWNHNPDNSLWSLTERPGFLRLRTGKTVGQLLEARNTLTQRTIGPRCQGTACMDISHMLPGDHAGLFSFCSQPGGLTVIRNADGYTLQMSDRGETKAEKGISGNIIWLRMDCDFTTDTARFSYSTNGKEFTSFGTPFHMIFSMDHFTGNKFAIFNYATQQAGGYVDVDSFELIQ